MRWNMRKSKHFQCFVILLCHSNTVGRGFESSRPCQKILVLRNEDFFIQAAGLAYHPTQVGISSKKAKIRLFVYHHALACISAAWWDTIPAELVIYKASPWWYTRLRRDSTLLLPIPSSPLCDTISVQYSIKKVSRASKEYQNFKAIASRNRLLLITSLFSTIQ